MKHLTYISSILLAAAVFADPADPQISNVRLNQNSISRRVTVQYDLDEAAVVTMDVLTNGVSIGGVNIQNVSGDCFRKVAAGNDHVVTWDPYLSWPDQKFGAGVVSVRMTAWALDNTPDYMAVDISAAAEPNTQKYYPAASFVPGGVTNGLYKTTMILMRKIMAKDVTWTMGSTALETQRNATREVTHQVTLTNNYYIGVFEVTQTQWAMIFPNRLFPSDFNDLQDRSMRPVEKVCYNEIRNNDGTGAYAAYNWPADPNPNCFLGLLWAKTGIKFDLPSEAQWEFAARAGHGATKWGDGSGILNTDSDANLNRLGRYERNGGRIQNGTTYTDPNYSCGATNGTAVVGSYEPNDWGLYDMYGNVWEWCLDWYADNITALNGKVNIDPLNSAKMLSGRSGENRLIRGGSWAQTAGTCRPAFRFSRPPSERGDYYGYGIGFRVIAIAGLQ